MGEGFGDYFGASVTAQFSGGFQDDCFAEWNAASISQSVPPCLRRLNSTKHYPENLTGEIHADGEIWSAALWEIRDAVGNENADRVVIASHFLMSPGASYNDGASALLRAATDLGYKRREVAAMRRILRARGFRPE